MQQMITGLTALFTGTAVNTTATIANTAAVTTQTSVDSASAGAGAAGGGGGGGGGFLGALSSIAGIVGIFDQGTSYVPRTGLAVIHEGEMIMPRGQSDAIRAGEASVGGGSGPHVHFHVNTLDSASAASMLERHHAAISKGVQAAMRGNSAGLHAAFARM
jgi:hypothetical protein